MDEKPAEKEENALGMALPSGTNTFVPSTNIGADEKEKKKKNYADLESEISRLTIERDEQKALVTAYQDRMASTLDQGAQQVAGLAGENRVLVRKNALQELAKVYHFDVAQEVELVQSMTDEQFDAHCSKVVVKYAKPPIGRPGVVVGELEKPALNAEDAGDVIPKTTVLKVAKYATEHKMDFKQAYKEVTGSDAPQHARMT